MAWFWTCQSAMIRVNLLLRSIARVVPLYKPARVFLWPPLLLLSDPVSEVVHRIPDTSLADSGLRDVGSPQRSLANGQQPGRVAWSKKEPLAD